MVWFGSLKKGQTMFSWISQRIILWYFCSNCILKALNIVDAISKLFKFVYKQITKYMCGKIKLKRDREIKRKTEREREKDYEKESEIDWESRIERKEGLWKEHYSLAAKAEAEAESA